MSEFMCFCGEMMLYDKERHQIVCPICNGTQPHTMDGKSNKELAAEEREEQEKDDEGDDLK